MTVARVFRLLCCGPLLAGCTVGPDFQPPSPPAEAGYANRPFADPPAAGGLPAQHFASGQDIPAQWWELFHSPVLDDLIARSLKANPDLQSAEAALHVAMENRRAQIGAYYPALTANLAASRNQDAATLSPALASSALLYSLYQAQLGVSWSLDLFGANRRQVEILQAQEEAQRLHYRALSIALAANIASAVIQAAAIREEIAAGNDVLTEARRALEIQRRQQAAGQISGADVAAQEAAVAQFEQALPPLQKQLEQQRDLLAALGGQMPDRGIDQDIPLSALQLPRDLPVSLPSKLVEQRPDIRIAEQNLHMASASIGVAIANMLPNITLTANAGGTATQLSQFASSGSGFWTIGAGLAQPLFEGGALQHRAQAARAAYDQAAAQYRSTVIGAFQNVADILHALESDGDNLAAASRAQQAAKRSLAVAQQQLQLGQIAPLIVINAEQNEQQARIALVQAEAARFSDTVALYQALGGGWWNQTDAVTGEKQ